MSVTSVTREERIKRIRDTFIMLAWTSARQFSQELQRFGLTLPQFVALAALVARDHPCTMSDLTKVTIQDPPTMTGIMDRLVKTKLVHRTRSQTDRRVVLVQATPAGCKLLRRIREEALGEVMADYLTLANNDDVADLDRILEVFERALEYILRVHLKRRHSLDAASLEAEVEKVQLFLRDPFCQSKAEAREQTMAVKE